VVGITLVETVVSLMVILIGLAGLFASSAQSFALLRRSKEIVAVRDDLLARLDGVRALSYAQVARSDSLRDKLMPTGAGGDPTPFGMTTSGMRNFTETITVYGLGSQLFFSDAARQAATPDWKDEYASQISDPAPAQPKTYKANSTAQGDWTEQVANTLPYIQLTRTGYGAAAATTVVTPGDLTADTRIVQLLVDVVYTWTDSNNVARTQVAILIVAKNGSLQ
jgi:type II secretory pathway pseudopilin PulG